MATWTDRQRLRLLNERNGDERRQGKTSGQSERKGVREEERERERRKQESAAANKRLSEIEDARRDAQENPTKFRSPLQQKQFLSYLDEEEKAERVKAGAYRADTAHRLPASQSKAAAALLPAQAAKSGRAVRAVNGGNAAALAGQETEQEWERERRNREGVVAADKRISEIEEARRDAQENPTKFRNPFQQKQFLSYLDEEEEAEREKASAYLADTERILQNALQHSREMLYNRQKETEALAEALMGISSAERLAASGGGGAGGVGTGRTGGMNKLLAPAEPFTRLAAFADGGAGQGAGSTNDGEDEGLFVRASEWLTDFFGRLFGGNEPEATPTKPPRATPPPTPPIVEFGIAPPTPTPPTVEFGVAPPTPRYTPRPTLTPNPEEYLYQQISEEGGANYLRSALDVQEGEDVINRRTGQWDRKQTVINDLGGICDELCESGKLTEQAMQELLTLGEVAVLIDELREADEKHVAIYSQPDDLDCSSFTKSLNENAGSIGGSSKKQYNFASMAPDWETTQHVKKNPTGIAVSQWKPEPGDFVFWSTNGSPYYPEKDDLEINHVGVYLGYGYILDRSIGKDSSPDGLNLRLSETVPGEIVGYARPPEELKRTGEDVRDYLQSLQ